MTQLAIWLLVILVGIAALGLVEAVRSGKLAGGSWQQVRTVAMGASLVLLTLLAGVLAVTWVIVIFLAEVWQPLLISIGAAIAGVTLIAMYARQRSFFYASALALAAAVILLVL